MGPSRVAATILLLALAPAAPAARAAPPARTLAVAAAASLRPALEELGPLFAREHPGAEVRPTYGASIALASQIRNGAPFDLLLSAEAAAPATLARDGLAAGEPFTYALGRLALWVPSSSGLDLERDGLRALLDPSVRKVAIANPATAPYGAAAEEALRGAGLREALQGRLVVGQSAAQAAQFAQSGNAGAAFLPLSLVRAPPLSTEGRHLLLPEGSHRPIEQAGVVLRGARRPELARAFAAFLLGPAGRAALARHGYGPPPAR